MRLHVYVLPSYYHIDGRKVLRWYDLSGWYDPVDVLWRERYERLSAFRQRCKEYLQKNNGRFMSHKKGLKIVMRNVDNYLVRNLL
jgi:hypothetical protein